ncbi:MAG: hypothetical protein KDD92_09070 [Caldilineaceae bacterium]|nr:hypothetical protein [Caldilineaceae bacterium]
MDAVEFEAKNKNGHIQAPDEFQKRFRNGVCVILPAADVNEQQDNLIEELLATPPYIAGFQPMQRDDIYVR